MVKSFGAGQGRTGCGSPAGGPASAAASARPQTPAWGCALQRTPARASLKPHAAAGCIAVQRLLATTLQKPVCLGCAAEGAESGTCARLLSFVPTPGGLAKAAADAPAQALGLPHAHDTPPARVSACACTAEHHLPRREAGT